MDRKQIVETLARAHVDRLLGPPPQDGGWPEGYFDREQKGREVGRAKGRSPMTNWTDEEIDAAAKALWEEAGYSAKVVGNSRRPAYEEVSAIYKRRARATLSAVKRVPEGYWLAPDEPDDEMGRASALTVTCHCGRRITQWGTNSYRAMRDVVKARGDGRSGAR